MEPDHVGGKSNLSGWNTPLSEKVIARKLMYDEKKT